jgi:pimeloyl-ACP methyl ester carboxylesterase
MTLENLFNKEWNILERIQVRDHYVPYTSKLHANLNKEVQLFVREYYGTGNSRKCVLMIHGRSSPAITTFDLVYNNNTKYSWAQYLARKGFDVFMLDFQGTGKSRLAEMENACNTSKDQQIPGVLIPNPLSSECDPSYPYVLTTSESEWDELDKVVEFIKNTKHVNKVSLISNSAGAWAVGPYAMQNAHKVESVLFNAPVFPPNHPRTNPPTLPQEGVAMIVQTKAGFDTGWVRELKCDGQREEGIVNEVWKSFLEVDPIGGGWGGKDRGNPEGLLRFRNATRWGWNTDTVSNGNLGHRVPVCIIYGEHDLTANQTTSSPLTTFSVSALYDAIPGEKNLMFKIACAGHLMIWEKQVEVLHKYSWQWLDKGKVEDRKRGSFYLNKDNQIVEEMVFHI